MIFAVVFQLGGVRREPPPTADAGAAPGLRPRRPHAQGLRLGQGRRRGRTPQLRDRRQTAGPRNGIRLNWGVLCTLSLKNVRDEPSVLEKLEEACQGPANLFSLSVRISL